MSITIEAGTLARAMKSAANVTSTRNTIPILANVRLVADGETLELTTTDMDVEYRETLPLAAPGKLATSVDARRLAAIASAAASGAQIALEPTDSRIAVRSGRSRWLLPALPLDDFPLMRDPDERTAVDLPGKALAAALKRVAWSMCDEPTRYYLCGVLLDQEEGKMRLVATNGHTIAVARIAEDWPDGAASPIVPEKFVRTIEHLAADAECVSLAWSERSIRARIGAITLTGKVIDGTYPDYRRVIPAPTNHAMTVEPEALRAAVQRATLISAQKSNAVAVSFAQDRIDLEATNQDGSAATEELPASGPETHRAGFNARYLIDALAAVGGDTIEIHQTDPGSVALIRRTVPDGALVGIMPMRL